MGVALMQFNFLSESAVLFYHRHLCQVFLLIQLYKKDYISLSLTEQTGFARLLRTPISIQRAKELPIIRRTTRVQGGRQLN